MTRTLLLAAAALAAAPAAAADRVLPFEPAITRLDNGLTVVAIRTPAKGIVAYYSVVRTGARDEVEPGRSGYAHFFEHMMFRGTPTTSPAAYNAALQALGADANAYTTADYTAYYIVGPARGLDTMVALEADRFQHLQYDEADFRTEAGAVLGEYNKAFSNPAMKLWETLADLAFDVHTYGHTVIGYGDDVKAMPEGYAYARQFFERHYTPDNTTVLVIGDVQPADVVAKVKAAYGPWRGAHTAPAVPAEPPQTSPRAQHVEWPSPTPPRLTIGWRVPGFRADDRDAAAVRVLAELVAGETSPLYRSLVLEDKRAFTLEHGGEQLRRDPSLLEFELVLVPGADPAPIGAALQAALDAVARGEVDAQRLAATRSHLKYARLMSLDTPGDVGGYLAAVVGLTGDVRDAERALQALSAVTAEDVARVAKAYFGPAQRVTVSLAHAEAAQ
ncbi:MAG: insulinase family protein [Myxococcales bacterium]|nr:insulinase family protein [Myxococcales bacterium]